MTCAQAQRTIRESPEHLAARRRLLLTLRQQRDWPAVGFFTSCPLHAPGLLTDDFVEEWAIDRVMIEGTTIYCAVLCAENALRLALVAETVAVHIPGELVIVRRDREWTEEAIAHVLQ